MSGTSQFTAFESEKILFKGPLADLILKVKKRLGKSENSSILIFSDSTGKNIDFNFQGSEKDVLKRLEIYSEEVGINQSAGPGRPRLGVVSRVISLLPRHWEWLATQSGGSSAYLRKLVDEARKKEGGQHTLKQLQERTYKFISVMAGDLNGYEEALRALYKRDEKKFIALIEVWPRDIRNHALELARPAFE